MTREEQINAVAKKIASIVGDNLVGRYDVIVIFKGGYEAGFIEGAKWADKNKEGEP
jgi:hypothetical protein